MLYRDTARDQALAFRSRIWARGKLALTQQLVADREEHAGACAADQVAQRARQHGLPASQRNAKLLRPFPGPGRREGWLAEYRPVDLRQRRFRQNREQTLDRWGAEER